MKSTRKSWASKLRPEMKPEVVDDPKGRGRLLLPTPYALAHEISLIPRGELLTVPDLRLRLARRFDADITCPLMTGIFYNIIAGASGEEPAPGPPFPVPWWRVVPENGILSPKTPPGPERQAGLLREEGHTLITRRNQPALENPDLRAGRENKPGSGP